MARRKREDRNDQDARERPDEPSLMGPPGSSGPEEMEARSAPVEDDDTPLERTDYADAFMPDPGNGPALIRDDLAETLAEEFVVSATTGEEYVDQDLHDVVAEEIGGPFIETTAAEEFAIDSDEMNPEDGTREPMPRAVSALTDKPND